MAEAPGRLYLGVNDEISYFGDNSGNWTVNITVNIVQVLQLNLCNSGFADCYKGGAAIDEAVSRIEALDPHVVTLNEICDGDLSRLRGAVGTGSASYFVAAREHDTGADVRCKNGQRYGNAVITSTGSNIGTVSGRYDAQPPGKEHRAYVCVRTDGYIACATHLSTVRPTAFEQCKEMMNAQLERFGVDRPVVVAGDLNLHHEPWPWEGPEVQDCVPPGYYRKGDADVQHVMASDDLGFIDSDVIGMDKTDHDALLVRLTLPPPR